MRGVTLKVLMARFLRLRFVLPGFALLLLPGLLPGGVHLSLALPYLALLVVVLGALAAMLLGSLLGLLRHPEGSERAALARERLSVSGRGLLAFAAVVGLAVLLPGQGKGRFDPDGWHAPGSAEVTWPNARTVRERMVDDLVTSVLPGRTVSEVRQLLGPSSAGDGGPPLYYVIAPHPMIDNVLLIVKFNPAGRFEGHAFGND